MEITLCSTLRRDNAESPLSDTTCPRHCAALRTLYTFASKSTSWRPSAEIWDLSEVLGTESSVFPKVRRLLDILSTAIVGHIKVEVGIGVVVFLTVFGPSRF